MGHIARGLPTKILEVGGEGLTVQCGSWRAKAAVAIVNVTEVDADMNLGLCTTSSSVKELGQDYRGQGFIECGITEKNCAFFK